MFVRAANGVEELSWNCRVVKLAAAARGSCMVESKRTKSHQCPTFDSPWSSRVFPAYRGSGTVTWHGREEAGGVEGYREVRHSQ
jgi:uncharacterized protein YkwD